MTTDRKWPTFADQLRNQCPASDDPHRPFIHPFNRSSPLAPATYLAGYGYLDPSAASTTATTNIQPTLARPFLPWPLLISLSVLLMLTIIGLLFVYAKQNQWKLDIPFFSSSLSTSNNNNNGNDDDDYVDNNTATTHNNNNNTSRTTRSRTE